MPSAAAISLPLTMFSSVLAVSRLSSAITAAASSFAAAAQADTFPPDARTISEYWPTISAPGAAVAAKPACSVAAANAVMPPSASIMATASSVAVLRAAMLSAACASLTFIIAISTCACNCVRNPVSLFGAATTRWRMCVIAPPATVSENAITPEGAASSSGTGSTVITAVSYIPSRLEPSGEVHEWLMPPPGTTVRIPALTLSSVALLTSQPSYAEPDSSMETPDMEKVTLSLIAPASEMTAVPEPL